MCKTIKQKVRFKADPQTIYDLLADSRKHAAFSRHRAAIGKRVGDPFSAYSGHITGINVDLVPGKRIVQAWRGRDFPAGIFSMATFNLKRTPNGGCELELIHRGVPKALIPGIEKNWRTLYWAKMKDFLHQRILTQ